MQESYIVRFYFVKMYVILTTKYIKGGITMIPKDPVMLLSYVNTQLRDFYADLDALCEDKQVAKEEIVNKLDMIDYVYDKERNQFV